MFSFTFYMVWLQREVPTHIQGRLMSTITTITMVASPLGLALFGALFDWQTTQPRLRDSLIFLEIQLENLHFLYTFLAAFFIPVNYTSLINKKEG
ncbi:TPA: hypothetical protein ACF3UD_000285 [Enterococcus faecium]|uniref:hypothetical protein n=1 Tax=Enterococcus faecium TaxID=1352 RepID=UPI0009A0D97D|nr:hypothetical protein [Enterococcus faecium]MDU1750765.1 hypothetical protein [Enterococcus faecium]